MLLLFPLKKDTWWRWGCHWHPIWGGSRSCSADQANLFAFPMKVCRSAESFLVAYLHTKSKRNHLCYFSVYSTVQSSTQSMAFHHFQALYLSLKVSDFSSSLLDYLTFSSYRGIWVSNHFCRSVFEIQAKKLYDTITCRAVVLFQKCGLNSLIFTRFSKCLTHSENWIPQLFHSAIQHYQVMK